MYHLIRSVTAKRLIVLEGPALLLALLVAEAFYKFGSFTLECLAFLPTWYVVSLLLDVIVRRTGLDARLN